MNWLREDCFIFRKQMPQYVEEDHLLVMGLRSDNRVFYAWIPIPEYPSHQREAYLALRLKFDSFLQEPATENEFSEDQYEHLVKDWFQREKAFMLDSFPDGE